MSGDAKVLNGLLERRELEAQFRELAQITDLALMGERAGVIARHGPPALSVLIAMLDTTDPQLRGGLGQVAVRLPRDEVAAALHKAARSHERGDQARLSALTILTRFLHEPVDETLLGGLADGDAVAAQSLAELIHAMDQSPAVVIEYLNQLAEQPPDVPGLILDAIPPLQPNPHLITLLRMFAQGEDAGLARAALEQLGKARSPAAAAALEGLAATLPPERAALAERGLRKLRMSGVAAPAPSAAERWRSLMSPVDGAGAQVIWFVRQPEAGADGELLMVLLQDPAGVVASLGAPQVPAAQLPALQPVGAVHAIPTKNDVLTLRLLESPFDAGRRELRKALALNWASGTLPPIEYRLLSAALWEAPRQAEDEEPAPAVPGEAGDAAALLDHPAFGSWFWYAPETEAAARRLGPHPAGSARDREITTLAQAGFTRDVVASYRRRLEAMARWLALGGDSQAAGAAMAAAVQLDAGPPAESPFVRRLIELGLDVAELERASPAGTQSGEGRPEVP